jgi:hypothetical protein
VQYFEQARCWTREASLTSDDGDIVCSCFVFVVSCLLFRVPVCFVLTPPHRVKSSQLDF